MKQRGFIALMSAIIISAILLVVAATAAITTLNTRFNILDSELKDRSSDAADACADEALLQLAMNPSYAGGTILSINSLDQCRVGTLSGTNRKTFKVQATSTNAVTNLQIVVNSGDLSVVSWQEIPTF